MNKVSNCFEVVVNSENGLSATMKFIMVQEVRLYIEQARLIGSCNISVSIITDVTDMF